MYKVEETWKVINQPFIGAMKWADGEENGAG